MSAFLSSRGDETNIFKEYAFIKYLTRARNCQPQANQKRTKLVLERPEEETREQTHKGISARRAWGSTAGVGAQCWEGAHRKHQKGDLGKDDITGGENGDVSKSRILNIHTSLKCSFQDLIRKLPWRTPASKIVWAPTTLGAAAHLGFHQLSPPGTWPDAPKYSSRLVTLLYMLTFT